MAVMDVVASCGGFGSLLYLFAVARAGAATVWGHGADCGEGVPF